MKKIFLFFILTLLLFAPNNNTRRLKGMDVDKHVKTEVQDGTEGSATSEPASFRNRVVGLRWVRVRELRPSPKNWRLHPQAQREAFRALVGEIGFASALIVRA